MSHAEGSARPAKPKNAGAKNPNKTTAPRKAKEPVDGQRRSAALKSERKISHAKQTPIDESTQEEAGDLFPDLWIRFGRYGWDVLGVGLIGFALLTLIGLLNRSAPLGLPNGLLLALWTNTVANAFGWGWPLLVAAIGLLGYVCLRQGADSQVRIQLGRVVALEFVAFASLAFLTIWNGWSLERALEGKDGGWIGWGLARILDLVFPDPWGVVVLISLIVLLTAYGTGFISWFMRGLTSWLNRVAPDGSSGTLAIDSAASRAALPGLAAQEDDEIAVAEPADSLSARRPELPPLDLLVDELSARPDISIIKQTAEIIERTLDEFGVPGKVVGFLPGPTLTQYALEPGFVEKPGPDGKLMQHKVRVSQISALSRDLALALSAERLRIEAPVPGRTYMGIEVPNPTNSLVRLRPLLEQDEFYKLASPLAIGLGKDVAGQPLVADLGRMPHLLIAGTTGSGKSVCIAAIATCLVMNNTPDDLRIAMLDPKMVELVRFNHLPHLLGHVETQLDRMLAVLHWAIAEMDRRYRLLETARARDLNIYNRKMEKRGQPKLPRIVIIIDELADLMMTAPDQTEHSLIRLAQLARATGIHLVVATQRPSTDVVTGLIKANFPARLAFSVASSIDSRVILDGSGAETLLGKGDMLFLNPEAGTPLRAQGVIISDDEIDAVTAFWQEHTPPEKQVEHEVAPWEGMIETMGGDENADGLVEQAARIVRETQRASTSLIQRRLRIGYPRAARLMDELEELGVVGPSMGGGREREVLQGPDDSTEPEDEVD